MKTIGIVLLAVALPALPLRASAQSEAPPAARVRLARYSVEPQDPRRAHVSASLELAGGEPVELLLTWFGGQRLEGLQARRDGEPLALEVEPPGESRLRRLRIPAAAGPDQELYLEYDVEVPESFAFRYPLPVPATPLAAGAGPVVIEVRLPRGAAWSADGFPRLTRAGERAGGALLRGRVSGVPAFVHVVFGEAAGGFSPGQRIQAVAIVVISVATALLAVRARRRARVTRP